MRLIDYTYFQQEPCLIPVNTVDGDVGAAKIAYIDSLIDAVQPRILKEIIGETLYEELMEGLAEATPDPKWTEMADKIRNETTLKSFLTYFVYIEDRRMSSSIATQAGDFNPQLANMQRSQNMQKNALMWNTGVEQSNDFVLWLRDNMDTYEIYTVGNIDKVNSFDI